MTSDYRRVTLGYPVVDDDTWFGAYIDSGNPIIIDLPTGPGEILGFACQTPSTGVGLVPLLCVQIERDGFVIFNGYVYYLTMCYPFSSGINLFGTVVFRGGGAFDFSFQSLMFYKSTARITFYMIDPGVIALWGSVFFRRGV